MPLTVFSLALTFFLAIIFFTIVVVRKKHKQLQCSDIVCWKFWAFGFLPQFMIYFGALCGAFLYLLPFCVVAFLFIVISPAPLSSKLTMLYSELISSFTVTSPLPPLWPPSLTPASPTTYSSRYIYKYITWIHKSVAETVGCGRSHKYTNMDHFYSVKYCKQFTFDHLYSKNSSTE